jgi:hypothetical protein
MIRRATPSADPNPVWKWTKRAMCGLVVALQSVALWSGEVPYFPIEVSRTAATTLLNRWLFPAGVLALVPVACLADGATTAQLRRFAPAWLGLLTLAWFDDSQYLLLHMAGVAAMLTGIVYARDHDYIHGLARFSVWSLPVRNAAILRGAALYGARVALKVITVAALESSSWWPTAIGWRANEIMQGTAEAHYPLVTLNVFRLCGVLQWVVFLLLSSGCRE